MGSATAHAKRRLPINIVLPVESGQNKKTKTVIETCCCRGVSGAAGCKKLPNIQNQGFVHYCARTNKCYAQDSMGRVDNSTVQSTLSKKQMAAKMVETADIVFILRYHQH